mmetsp:Transcript_3559/g.5563  ORF Transcript_3559/g.5563 Transcript_3559/m.5563 type:complete len:166 (+) Transcript_3559:416-913(+)
MFFALSRRPSSFSTPRPYEAARLSQTVKDAQPCEDDEDNESPEDVEILKVDSPCLEKVVEFLKHYQEDALKDIKTPLEDNTFDGVVKQVWYQDFVKGVDQPMLFDLVTAANFMAIQPLLDLTCLQVSCQLMGKSAEEIRVILNIPRLTAEEEVKARQDHRWIFDD